MKVLVVGSGGRESAICWKLKQSPMVGELFIAPGNPGTAKLGKNVNIPAHDVAELKKFALEKKIDLTIVGPEDPLVRGIVDEFRSEGLRIFGPTKAAAQLEGSKEFAKEVMIAAGVPTAAHAVFDNKDAALQYAAEKGAPLVVKADGLAGGKGVFVCMTKEELEKAIPEAFERFGSSRVILEEYLDGVEASYIIATDGKRIVPFAASHDYKRVHDNNQGPNTGGMGTVSPTPHLTKEQESWASEHIIKPVVDEMAKRGTPYSGFLYAGLMITANGIKVLEFNARLGDPETQVIMRRMDSDLCALLNTLTLGEDATFPEVKFSDESAVCLVLAAEGYPDNVKKGDKISGIDTFDKDKNIVIFHAGTKEEEDGAIYTSGGRVLCVTARGKDIAEARKSVYEAAEKISFRGMHYRKDIAIS